MILAFSGVYTFGLPRRSWLGAIGGMAVLLLVTRLITPTRDNVNLAHHVHDGWERMFPSHLVYLLLLLCASGLIFFAVEAVTRRLLKRRAG